MILKKAIELAKTVDNIDNFNQRVNAIKHVLLIQDHESKVEQDKLTRHACAEAVQNCDMMDDQWVHSDTAYDACINCKAIT